MSVDVDDDEEVGLGVLARVDAGGWLVQADFDSLPFVPGQFDVVVLNASLHYAANPVCTLYAADRMLATGGALVVMDSPMFVRDEDGQLMVREQLESIARLCGVMQPLRAGAGFLTFTQLRDAAHRLHRRARFTASDGPVGWRLRRFWSRRRRGRAPASFGVWVAR
ncbi:MAG: methyltransferase domain-containing protein [Vicinamibacterales bacterium]